MTTTSIKLSLLTVAATTALTLSSPAFATTIQLYVNGSVAQASSNGPYPAHAEVQSEPAHCWSESLNAWNATVDYNGVATYLTCTDTYGFDVENGNTSINFEFVTGGVGTHSVECSAEGISATVLYTISDC